VEQGYSPTNIQELQSGNFILVNLPVEVEIADMDFGIEGIKLTCKTKDNQSHVVYLDLGSVLWKRVFDEE
jgi:hypothetical protein